MSFQPGDVIDNKYRVVRLIGEGGMGAVYEGENTRISRRVAIKVLRTEAANRPELAARFEREARAAGRIGSKHVCDVLDLGDLPSGDSYLVMELLDGEDLAARLKTHGRIPDAEALAIGFQLLDGLAAMHEAGIIHRDLKPANVFLVRGPRGDTVKILDFGVSKFVAQNESLHMTQTGAVMGTPLYMSPEQARGAKDIDARSDLYAVGVVLYKAVTSRLPFKGDNFNEILFKIALETPPRVEEIAPDVDPLFSAIIEKAMAKDPNERYQTAREFQSALRDLGTARGLVLETSISIPPTGSLTPGRGVMPPPSLPPPSRVPSASSMASSGMHVPAQAHLPNLPSGTAALAPPALAPPALAPSPVPYLALHPSEELSASEVAHAIAQSGGEPPPDGFTATAWAGRDPRASRPDSRPDSVPAGRDVRTRPFVAENAASGHGAAYDGRAPTFASAKSVRLAASLEEENLRARARSRNITAGIVSALLLLGAASGVAWTVTKRTASSVAPSPEVGGANSAVSNSAVSTGSTDALNAESANGAGTGADGTGNTTPAPPADVPGVAITALPLATSMAPAPVVNAPVSGPAGNAGLTGERRGNNVGDAGPPSAPAPSVSGSAAPAKRAWGPIAPALPVIEKATEKPSAHGEGDKPGDPAP